MKFDNQYWEERYKTGQTGWDVGEITTPLKEYFDGLKNRDARILIPGAGNGYEPVYLFNRGFTDVTVIDLAQAPLSNIREQSPGFPAGKLIRGDFFNHRGTYDLIVEQTFFCALDPSLRPAYASKMAELLEDKGILAGLLFDEEFEGGPPFGGSKSEYLQYFEPFFKIITMERCYNSIKPRQDRELFMILEKS